MKIPINGIVEVEEQDEDVKEEEEDFGNSPFTEQQLLQVWEQYAAKKKAEGRESEYHVLQQKIRLVDEHTVEISIINKLQEDFIDKMKVDLMRHLRRSLKNGEVNLKVAIAERSEQKMLYTNREKLEYLQEKKPAIRLLRERLGLDPDF